MTWIVLAVIGATVIYVASSRVHGTDPLANAVLSFTAVIIWWYTVETHSLRQLNRQMLIESVKPHLKVQFKSRSVVRAQIPERHPSSFLWTSIEVMNEGQGVALNLDIICKGSSGYSQAIKKLPAIRGNGGAAQMVYESHTEDQTLSDFNMIIQKKVEFIIKYQDSLGTPYIRAFIADEYSADTFSEVLFEKKFE